MQDPRRTHQPDDSVLTRIPYDRPRSHSAVDASRRSTEANDVDSWIDDLDEADTGEVSLTGGDALNANAMVGWMVQQHLPIMELPTFNGTPHEWVNFIVKF